MICYHLLQFLKVAAIYSLYFSRLFETDFETDVGWKSRDGTLQKDTLKGIEKIIFQI